MPSVTFLSFLFLLVLQQTLEVTASVTPVKVVDNELSRILAQRRLRAPLMGRSLPFINEKSIHDDDEDFLDFDKRQLDETPLNQRKWVKSKRRGPLFG